MGIILMVILLPILVYLLLNRRFKELVTIMLWIIGMVGLVSMPFLIKDFENYYYSIVGFEGMRLIYGVTIWKFFVSHPWELFAQKYANLIMLLIMVIINACIFVKRKIRLESAAGWSMWAITMILFTILAKWFSLHYLFLPFPLLFVWL